MFKILLVDQFAGPTPYALQQEPMRFEDLCKLMLAEPPVSYGTRTQVLEVDDSYTPPYAATAFRADAGGFAEVWRARWDSSG